MGPLPSSAAPHLLPLPTIVFGQIQRPLSSLEESAGVGGENRPLRGKDKKRSKGAEPEKRVQKPDRRRSPPYTAVPRGNDQVKRGDGRKIEEELAVPPRLYRGLRAKSVEDSHDLGCGKQQEQNGQRRNKTPPYPGPGENHAGGTERKDREY
jgi:hypothetical protein